MLAEQSMNTPDYTGKLPPFPGQSGDLTMRILIADDNNINREFLKAALSEPGIEIAEAVNGRDALDQYQLQRFDLILMDIRMPEMDGIEATREIRRCQSADQVPTRIVGLTADLQLSTTNNLKQEGFDLCLAKPISRETVRQLIAGQPLNEPNPVDEQFPVQDREAALAAAGGNTELLQRLMGMLQKELERFLPEISEAVNAGDYATAVAPVHKLRGSAGYTGCVQLKQTAAQLELALTRGNTEEVRLAMDDLSTAALSVSQL